MALAADFRRSIMKKRKSARLLLGVLLGAFCLSGPAAAQVGTPPANPLADLHVPVQDDPAARALALKLKSIVIDKIDFDQMDIADVLKFLAAKSKQLDPDKTGINFVLVDPSVHRAVTMKLEDVPMDSVLDLIGQQTGLRFSVDPYAVTCGP
jgi:type II secretory pathway component HofQ